MTRRQREAAEDALADAANARNTSPNHVPAGYYPCPSDGMLLGADQVNDDGENSCPGCGTISRPPVLA